MSRTNIYAVALVIVSAIFYLYALFSLQEAKMIRRDLGNRIEVARAELTRIEGKCQAIMNPSE